MAIETTSDLSLVGTSQIVDGSVTSAKIGAGAVVAAGISAGAVGSAAISAGAVGTAAISSGAATSGQILQANGSGAVAFATPAAGGGMTLIATATLSAATSLAFTSIPTTYKNLVVRWFGVYMSVETGYWNVRVNSDSGSNYAWQYLRAQTTAFSASNQNSATQFGNADNTAAVIPSTTSTSTDYEKQGGGLITFYDYAATSGRRQIQSFAMSVSDAVNAYRRWVNYNGMYLATGTAITSIEFIRGSTETITGTFYLYGVS
jgi:hypothetical protein